MKTRLLNQLVAISAVVCASVVATHADTSKTPKPEELRQRCVPALAPLPAAMPGAEKDTPALVNLGKQLFFDVRLSANDSQSCNSCHAVDKGRGGVDNQPTSPGAFGKRGGRNSPTVLNAGLHSSQFWDGRAGDLAAQAKGPILNPIEMAMPSEQAVVDKLNAIPEYKKSFARAFPGVTKPLTYDNIALAIAAFERTLITKDRLDDFLRGQNGALSADELQGLDLFVTIGCTACHNGPTVGGNSYQKRGLIHPPKLGDVGRFAVTKDEDDMFKFKVPSLRNISLTAPYFHDGSRGKLEEAVKDMAWEQLDRKLSDDEVKSLTTFLNALADKERASSATKPRASR